MDSPVRKALKLKDYLRHKLLRRIKRKNKNEREKRSNLLEKTLRKKLNKPVRNVNK